MEATQGFASDLTKCLCNSTTWTVLVRAAKPTSSKFQIHRRIGSQADFGSMVIEGGAEHLLL
jgi:hypothetical protein